MPRAFIRSPRRRGRATRTHAAQDWNVSSSLQESHCLRSALFRAVARHDAHLGGVLGRKFFDYRLSHRLVRGIPAGNHFPRAAVPLLNACSPGALVIGAGNLHRPHHALKPEFFEARLVNVEILEPPTPLLSRQPNLAELLLGFANPLHSEHGSDKPSILEDLSDLPRFAQPLPLGIDVPLNIGMHRELAGAVLEHQGLVAPRVITGRPHVGLRTGPPHADYLVE